MSVSEWVSEGHGVWVSDNNEMWVGEPVSEPHMTE